MMDRRTFLKSTLMVAAASAVASNSPALVREIPEAEKEQEYNYYRSRRVLYFRVVKVVYRRDFKDWMVFCKSVEDNERLKLTFILEDEEKAKQIKPGYIIRQEFH